MNTRAIPFISVMIGFCQSLIPLTGYLIGNILGTAFGETSTKIGAFLLVFIGLQLIRESTDITPKQIGQNLILANLGVGFEDLMAGVNMELWAKI
ncbi:manganese efflux pump [Desulfosporosinus sp.]|uniref:manganese efflux pump n=1 Tax=Desulfosporosinus sp. TaxID=157907 RepID=UPI0002498F2D|nr:manganese efflux pump [Desulfosporosinus sp.]